MVPYPLHFFPWSTAGVWARRLLGWVVLLAPVLLPAQVNWNQPAAELVRTARLKRITEKDGLPLSSVNEILIDREGYVWMGSRNEGVCRYDGQEFRHFLCTEGDTTGLLSNYIQQIYEDSSGRIWIVNNGGINRYDPVTGRMRQWPVGKKQRKSFLKDEIPIRIRDAGQGWFWLTTTAGGLMRFHAESGRTERWQPNHLSPSDHNFRDKNLLHHIEPDRLQPDKIWLTSYAGLYQFDINQKAFVRHFPYRQGSKNFIHFQDIRQDTAGVLWLCGWGDGVVLFNTKTLQWENQFLPDPGSYPSGTTNILFSTLPKSPTECWVAAAPYGFGVLDLATRKFHFLQHRAKDPTSILPSDVYAFAQDKQGNIWIANQFGLCILMPAYQRYRWCALLPDSIWVDNIVEHPADSGTLLLGTVYTGPPVIAWNRRTGAVRDVFSGKLGGRPARTLFISPSTQEAYLSTPDYGVLRFSPDAGTYSKLYVKTAQNRREPVYWDTLGSVYHMAEDPAGYIWMAAHPQGLIRYHPHLETLRIYRHQADHPRSLLDNWIIHCYPDSSGNVWIPTAYGMSVYRPDTDDFDNYPSTFSQGQTPRILPVLRQIVPDQLGRLWVCGYYGLQCFDPARPDKPLHTFTAKEGLPVQPIEYLCRDRQGRIWFSSSKMMGCIDPETLRISTFGAGDGFPLPYISGFPMDEELHLSTLSSGEMAISNLGGVWLFEPDEILPPRTFPKVTLTNFQVFENGRPLREMDLGSVPNEPDKILELTYAQRTISFSFSCIYFENASRLEFAYKLENYDPEWIFPGSRRFANYTNLPPGRYRLRIRAELRGVPGSRSEKIIALHIGKPFWQQLWFLTLAAAAMFFLGFFAYKTRIRQVRLAEQHKAALQQQRIESELKALRAQMNPHFLFNSLNSINRYILRNNGEAASNYLTKFARLIRAILSTSSLQTITLQEEMQTLRLYLEMEAMRLEHKFEYSLEVDPALNPDQVRVPTMLIQPYVENAIWHGLSPRETNGILKVAFSKHDNFMVCTVEDNGIGRKKAQELAGSFTSDKNSMGLQLTAERMDYMNHLYDLGLKAIITDLEDPTGRPQGTRVDLFVKIH